MHNALKNSKILYSTDFSPDIRQGRNDILPFQIRSEGEGFCYHDVRYHC